MLIIWLLVTRGLSLTFSVQLPESSVIISDPGTEFSPIDEQALLLEVVFVPNFIQCVYACHVNYLCRNFDYDSITYRCRVFEGDIPSTGSIISSNSSTSTAAQIEISPDLFSANKQSCNACSNSRYLTCTNLTCNCFQHTYWTGSICASQSLLGDPCSNSTQCRVDLNLTCLQFFQCGPTSLLSGTTVFGSLNGSAGNSSSSLNAPWGIMINADDSILIADTFNKRVIVANQNISTAVMIVCAGQSISPSKAVFDRTLSNIYILDFGAGRMMLWRNNSGTCVSLFGASGSGLNQLSNPADFYLDSQQNFYIADRANHRILFWPMNASNGTLVAGVTGVPGNGSLNLNFPSGVIVDEVLGLMYVADFNNHRIVRYTLGSLSGTVVAGGNGPGTARNQVRNPIGLCQSKKTGALYIAEQTNNRISRWFPGDTQGVTIAGSPIGVSGSSSLLLNTLNGVVLDDDEKYMFVSDRNNSRVQRFELI